MWWWLQVEPWFGLLAFYGVPLVLYVEVQSYITRRGPGGRSPVVTVDSRAGGK